MVSEKEPDSNINRLQLIRTLTAIAPEQLDIILFSLKPPDGIVPPMSATQGSRVSALLKWAESPGGCTLIKVQQLLDEIIYSNSVNSSPPSEPITPQESNKEKNNLPSYEFKTITVDRKGKIIKTQTLTAQYFIEYLPGAVELEMVLIPGGTFMMGTEEEEIERLKQKYNTGWFVFDPDLFNRERPQHLVTVPQFFMGKYPITRKQWRAIASLPPVERNLDPNSFYSGRDHEPIQSLNWVDAVEFCKRLSRETGRDYRLPSEAEWEYACRAAPLTKGGERGSKTTPFYFGETITGELANYHATWTYADEPKGEYREKTTPVGQFPPNAFGLYDMHGNVWEWCLDDWHENYVGAPSDGSAWLNEKNNDYAKVIRGGSWYVKPSSCRCAYRNHHCDYFFFFSPNNIGFRVVCALGKT